MPTYGVTPTGFVRKPLAVILAEMEAAEKASISPSLNTSETAVAGQFNAVMGAKFSELWEQLQAVDAGYDPDRAEDAQQDALYSLTNSLRRKANKSRVTATVNLAAGANIAIGAAIASVDGVPSARFVNTTAMVNGGGSAANFNVVFEAEETGPVVANADTLTVRETTPSGWNSITNDDDASLGANIESNAAYRLRRVAELSAQGGGTVDGVRADILRLLNASGAPVVRSAQVIENDTDATDANGLPPHSFEALVDYDHLVAGANAAIAASIWSNKPAGIYPHGTTVVTVQDSEGEDHVVRFTQVAALRTYVYVDYALLPAGAPSGPAPGPVIAAAVIDAEDPAYLGVGTDVYASALLCALIDAGVHPAVQVGVSSVSIEAPPFPPLVTVGLRQRATISSADVASGPA